MEDTLGIGGVGGFVDTEGSAKQLERDSSEEPASHSKRHGVANVGTEDVLKDELEDRLKDILFGKQPFHPSETKSSVPESWDSGDEVDEEVAHREERQQSQRSKFEREPAWQDADDARIR